MQDNSYNDCEYLHRQLERLPLLRYPFNLEKLPDDGIYFFYEEGEVWGHGGDSPKIVRVGAHKHGNFKSRISEHFLLNERKMDFTSNSSAPKDRSIFRKNIGRALLNMEKSDYLKTWELDFTKKENRAQKGSFRDIPLEKAIERKITQILVKNFSFRFIEVKNEMGGEGLEGRLIGTLAGCDKCRPSQKWLGLHSPKQEIIKSGLWLVHHLQNSGLTLEDKIRISGIVDSRF